MLIAQPPTQRTPRQNVCACVNLGISCFALVVRLAVFQLVAVNQQPQIKEQRTTNTKRYVDNSLFYLLLLEMFVGPFRRGSAVAAGTD